MVTHEEFERATRRAERKSKIQPKALSVSWRPASKKIVIALSSGLEIMFAPGLVQGLETGSGADF